MTEKQIMAAMGFVTNFDTTQGYKAIFVSSVLKMIS